MKQILEKLSGQIPNAINSLFFLLFGASIVALFGQVVEAWLNYPFPLAACCGLSFVIGVAAHRFFVSLSLIETKQDKMKRVNDFKRLDYDLKTLIARTYFFGETVTAQGFYESYFAYDDPLEYLDLETKHDGDHYTLNVKTKKLLDNHPELVSQFNKEMLE